MHRNKIGEDLKMLNKRGIVTEYLPWLLIALAILAIVMIALFILKDSGVSLIEQIKNILKFS